MAHVNFLITIMKKHLIFCTALFYGTLCFAQNDSLMQRDTSQARVSMQANNFDPLQSLNTNGFPVKTKPPSPYKTSFLKDGLVITGAVGVTLLGYSLIKNKSNLTPEDLAGKTKDNLPFFDRGIAGNYSSKANKDSYILFDADYAIPLVFIFLNKNERAKAGQLVVLYVETIGITGAMYTLTAGLVYRSRPFVYGDKAPLDKRLDKGGQRSFYGGHVATTAAATFLTAKLFADFNPNSKLRPWLYVAAGGLTAVMAYERMQAGYHFLSDCVLSGIIGAATGILIPDFHKNRKFENVSLEPAVIYGNTGMRLTYHF